MTPAPPVSTIAPETAQSFVLLRLGERRFAVPALQIAELVAPSRHRFADRRPETYRSIIEPVSEADIPVRR